jgi:hypothetical protein
MTSLNLLQRSLRVSRHRLAGISVLSASSSSHFNKNAHLWTRGVASTVSNRPASQNLSQAGLNIKEESQNAAGDLQKVIAGTTFGNTGFVSLVSSLCFPVFTSFELHRSKARVQ